MPCSTGSALTWNNTFGALRKMEKKREKNENRSIEKK